MTTVLHLDASARPGLAGTHAHGSHTRALTHRFVERWRAARPGDHVIVRDVGATPPAPVTADWVAAAFTTSHERTPEQRATLAESDRLVDELRRADVLVLGVPMYNFGPPAAFKAWIDQIVRIGETFDYDPTRADSPYIPLLADRPRRTVLLSARGGNGFDAGGEMAHMNHLDPAVVTALGFLGVKPVQGIAVEHQEHGGELLAASVAQAQARVDALVDGWLIELTRAEQAATVEAGQDALAPA